MNDLRIAAQQALEALENALDAQSNPMRQDFPTIHDFGQMRRAHTDLRAALAQQEQCADESDCTHMPWCRVRKACQRAALAQQEPVAVHQFREANSAVWYDGHADRDDGNGPYEERVLYTAPPRREWVGLTEEERTKIIEYGPTLADIASAVEQACKEKNHG